MDFISEYFKRAMREMADETMAISAEETAGGREDALIRNSLKLFKFAIKNKKVDLEELAGRVTGFMREFGPTSSMGTQDGFNFLVATVAHLFDNPDTVTGWTRDIFLKDFADNVGEGVGGGHQLVSAQPLAPQGFFDEAVALRVLQGGPSGLVSSTVVDFRVGRILGVAFVGTVGDHQRLDLATELGLALEKRIVKVALGGG